MPRQSSHFVVHSEAVVLQSHISRPPRCTNTTLMDGNHGSFGTIAGVMGQGMDLLY